jgi:hypothetical protein
MLTPKGPQLCLTKEYSRTIISIAIYINYIKFLYPHFQL